MITGQWADLPLAELAAEVRRVGLRRPRARDAGATTSTSPRRSRDPAYCAGRRELLERHGLSVLGDLRRTSSARRSATRSTTRHAVDPAARGVGRRRSRGRPRRAPPSASRTPRARRRALGVDGRHRVHRLADLAPALLVPAERLRRRSSAATRSSPSAGRRSSTSSTPRACGSRSRCTRPRSPTTSSRRAKALDALDRRAGVRHQLRPVATSCTSSSTRRRSSTTSPTGSTTCTSRTPSGASTGARSILGGHLDFGDPRRGWEFVSPGHGDVDFEAIFRALNRAGYDGPALDRVGGRRDGPRVGRADALAFVRRTDFAPSTVAFDAAFSTD